MKKKRTDENAKDPHWVVPVDLPGVSPEDYPEVRRKPKKPVRNQ